MQTQPNYIGIDISKKFFDAFIAGRHYHFENEEEGFIALTQLLQTGHHHVVMEASGPYYLRLAFYLHSRGIKVSVVNPLVIRRFSQMQLSRTKTDKKDAQLIAAYGAMTKPAQWQPPEQQTIILQQIEATMNGLVKQRTVLNNQLESFASSGMLDKTLKKILEKELVHLQQLLEKLSARMHQIIQAHYGLLLANLKSIPGIGEKTAMMLIVISGGFERFADHRQLSSYIGICPRIFESGSSVKGKARICKMGMSAIRASLYVCSWSAKRCNKACRELYERLVAKGKAKKLALIAVANKLLKQALAIAKTKTIYQENYPLNICF